MSFNFFKYIYSGFFLFVISISAFAEPSICYGTTAKGKLHQGVSLPLKGNNFISYSEKLHAAGRTFVHADVGEVIVLAYQELEKNEPNKVYKYAETGFKNGGEFKPHKTHQNGLSVDFMTPVINKKDVSNHLPTNEHNRYGYDIEFNRLGEYQDKSVGVLKIDYEAMAAHIVALHQQAIIKKIKIWRVIFAPELQAGLFKTKYSKYLKQHIQFSKKPSWVRHDEHYHIDFDLPCKPL